MQKTKTEPAEKAPVSRKVKAWEIFSQYIKVRDSVEGWGQCRICGKWVSIYKSAAGRYNRKEDSPVFLDEKNGHLICMYCLKVTGKVRKRNTLKKFKDSLIKKFGEAIVKELEKAPVSTWDSAELLKLTQIYRTKLNELGGYNDK